MSAVDDLRAAFDRSFAEAPVTARAAGERVLAVRVGGDPYAVRLDEIAGIAPAKRIVPLPGAPPHLLGLAGHRSALVAVFDLAALLGYAPSLEPPRWLVLAGHPESVGFALHDLEGHLEIPLGGVARATGEAAHRHVRGSVRVEGVVRGVVDMSSLLKSVGNEREA